MSLAVACWITLARTLLVLLVAWPVCEVLDRWFRGLSDSWRTAALFLLLAPFCFPEMLVGYAYRDFAMTYPAWAEGLCGVLLLVRVIPVGTIVLMAAPAPDRDAAAIHCRRLLSAGATRAAVWTELYRCYWHGPVCRALPALGLMALIAMQEFELAALLMATSWTDWFIMAQRLGLERNEMLWQALKPLALQLPLLIGIVVWLNRASPQAENASSDGDASASERSFDSGTLALATVLVCIPLLMAVFVPLGLMGWRTVEGIRLLLRQRTQMLGLFNEIVVASLISISAGMFAWWIASRVTRLRASGRGAVVPVALLLPGLFGSLLVSLAIVTAFQQPWLRPLYDTPLPWGCALIVWLLPRAVVLQLWLDALRPAEAVHLTELCQGLCHNSKQVLGGRGWTEALRRKPRGFAKTLQPRPPNLNPDSGCDKASGPRAEGRATERQFSVPLSLGPCPSSLLWRLRDEPRWLAIGLLCYWAYCDLPTAYLLAPTRMAPGLVRLYNFMHFGRSSALSGEAILFFGLPVIGMTAAMMIRRRWRYRTQHE